MPPFGETLLLWRLHRGLTQGTLAQRAHLSRPNLSAIERGKREVSLTTLRALSAALEVRPGILVDGIAPVEKSSRPLSRERLERIAEAVVTGKPLPDAEDRAIVEALSRIVGHRKRAWRAQTGEPSGQGRAARLGWLWLEAAYSQPVAQSLLQRVSDRLRSQ